MKEVQGISTLVRVSEGSGYRESPVISLFIKTNQWNFSQVEWKKPVYTCTKMLFIKGLLWTHPKDSGQFVYFIDIYNLQIITILDIYIYVNRRIYSMRKVMREILFTSLRTWLDVVDKWRLINKKMTFARQSRRGRYSSSFKTLFSFVRHWKERTRAWKGDNFESV